MPKIMVIDDDIDFLFLISKVLRSAGHGAITFSDGIKWLDQIDTFKPDLLLLDIQLHYEDGREMCRKIKRMPKYASIPVILYSGHEAQYADIQQYGAEDFVEKRFMKDRILDLITFHLAAKAAS